MTWTFPDQAIHMNRHGHGFFEVPTPHQDMVVGSGPEGTKHFRDLAIAEARARMRNTKLAEEGFLGLRNTTARSQRYDRPASRSDVPNGVFPGFPYVSAAGFLRGGTGAITKEGREWVHKRLAQRIAELNAIDAQDYSRGPPQRIEVTPQFTELDTMLTQFLDQFEAGTFTSGLTDQAFRLQQALVKAGASLTPEKIAEVMSIIARLEVAAERLATSAPATGQFALNPDRKAVLRSLSLTFDRIKRILEEINRVAYEEKDVREMVMRDIGSRIVPSTAESSAVFGQEMGYFRPGDLGRNQSQLERRRTTGVASQRRERIGRQEYANLGPITRNVQGPGMAGEQRLRQGTLQRREGV